MDIFLTEEQKDLKALIKDFMTKEVKPRLREIDESGEFPVDLYRKAFDLGFHALSIPEEYGGGGMNHVTMGVLLEEMAYTDPGFAITMLCTSVAMECVLMAGTEEQKARACELIMDGGFGAFCLTEPSCGSDAAALRTTYKIDGDTVVLNGSKCFATNAQEANLYIIFATKDRSLGSKGITAFMVERGTPGLTVGNHENKMGLRLSNTCEIALDEVKLPLSAMLGKEGGGMRIALGSLDEGRLNNAALSTGICQAALDEAVAYAKVRTSFGKPLIEHQAIQMMLANPHRDIPPADAARYGCDGCRLESHKGSVYGKDLLRGFRHACHYGRGPGPGRIRLFQGVPRREDDAGCENLPDL